MWNPSYEFDPHFKILKYQELIQHQRKLNEIRNRKNKFKVIDKPNTNNQDTKYNFKVTLPSENKLNSKQSFSKTISRVTPLINTNHCQKQNQIFKVFFYY